MDNLKKLIDGNSIIVPYKSRVDDVADQVVLVDFDQSNFIKKYLKLA